MSCYLVTGVAGFIGAAVARELLSRGEEVVGVDDLNASYDPKLKMWRLEQLKADPGFTFHKLDITNYEKVASLFALHLLDQVPCGIINLAARAGVRPSTEDPWVYYETNVVGTLNLLHLCREYRIPKLVLASTSSVYGAHNIRPFREDADTDRPLSPYAASKKAAENLCYTYHHLYGIDVTVLRYFTVYGPAGRPDMSVFRFVRWITEGETVILYGDGTQERDFTFIDDIARGTVAALRPLGFEIINLGGDRPVSMRRVLELVEELVGRKARIELRPEHQADVPATWADTAKARRLLGWESSVPLEEGLKRTVDWYAKHRALGREVALP